MQFYAPYMDLNWQHDQSDMPNISQHTHTSRLLLVYDMNKQKCIDKREAEEEEEEEKNAQLDIANQLDFNHTILVCVYALIFI